MQFFNGTLWCLVICLSSISSFGQYPQGRFFEGDDFMDFEGSTVNFDIQSEGGITSTTRGAGTFSRIENYLIISTEEYPGKKSSVKKVCDVPFSLSVVNMEGRPQPFATLEFIDSKGKRISIMGSSKEELRDLVPPENAEFVEVTSLGVNPIKFKFSENCRFVVTIAEDFIIENSWMAFKMDSLAPDFFKLQWIGNYEERPSLKKIKRRERRTSDYWAGRMREFKRP